MHDFATIYLNSFVAGLLAATIMAGVLLGLLLKSLTRWSDKIVFFIAGAAQLVLPIGLAISYVVRHGWEAITYYSPGHTLFQAVLLFGLGVVGARIGLGIFGWIARRRQTGEATSEME